MVGSSVQTSYFLIYVGCHRHILGWHAILVMFQAVSFTSRMHTPKAALTIIHDSRGTLGVPLAETVNLKKRCRNFAVHCVLVRRGEKGIAIWTDALSVPGGGVNDK